MRGQTGEVWAAAVFVARQFVGLSPAKTSFALYIFGDKAREQIGFSRDKSQVLKRLNQIQADRAYASEYVHGVTALLDAILESVKMFASPEAGDLMLVISDGDDNASHSKESALSRALLSHHIRLFTCLMTPDSRPQLPPIVATVGPEILNLLSEASGGLFLRPLFGQDFETIDNLLAGHPLWPVLADLTFLDKQAAGYNLLEFALPAPVVKTEKWKLKLSHERSGRLKGARLLYPRELVPCPGATPH